MISNAIIILALIAAALCTFLSVAALAALSANKVQENLKFYRDRFTGSADVELRDMFVTMDPSRLFILNVMALVIVPFLIHSLFQLWVVTGGAILLLMVMPGTLWRRLRNKRMKKLEEQLPDAFLMIASSLQSGASFSMALETLVYQAPPPLSQEFGLLVKRMRLGVPMEDGLLEMEKRIPMQSFVMASSAVRISREVGGNLVRTIQSMAETLRRKHTMEGKIDSLTAQGRAQGRFMGALPVVVGIGLHFLEPEAMRQLYTTRLGLMILFVMVVMQVLGFLFIRKITSIDS